MVVGDDGSTLSLVRQVDHQVQCRDMAMAWGAPGFARLDHWDSVVRAAARHDDGWRAQDESPGVDGDGRPEDFPDVARDRHAAFYDEAIAAVCADDARAGLVCCLHGRGLYEKRLGLDGPIPGRRGRPAVERDFIARQLRRQRALQRALGPGADAWGADAFLLLQAWDALSLYLVWTGLRRGEPWRLARVPRGPGAGRPRSACPRWTRSPRRSTPGRSRRTPWTCPWTSSPCRPGRTRRPRRSHGRSRRPGRTASATGWWPGAPRPRGAAHPGTRDDRCGATAARRPERRGQSESYLNDRDSFTR